MSKGEILTTYTCISHYASTFVPLSGFGTVDASDYLKEFDLYLHSEHIDLNELLLSECEVHRWDDNGIRGGVWAEFTPELKEWFREYEIKHPEIMIYTRRKNTTRLFTHFVLRFNNAHDLIHFKLRWFRA